jgi:serine-type D-Ala-D-Ala carboxypeptidase/endopeptidase (penicillin-binding protein 4)
MKDRPRLPRWVAPLTAVLFLTIVIAAATGAWRDPEGGMFRGNTAVASGNAGGLGASQPEPANDAELAVLIDQTIDSSDFARARWGVHVISVRDGRRVYARNADRLFTPASNMKVYTTAVALDLLGADYRWRTSVYAETQPDANGTINGDLILYGRGAPDLTSRPAKETPASLNQLADELYQRGVRRVHGNVIGDESYFRCEALGDGWQWNDVQWYFGAEPSALSIDDNEVEVEIKPPTKAGDPPVAKLSREQGDLQITSDMATVKSGEQLTIGIHRGLSQNEVHVWGEFPTGSRGFSARLSVHNPARMAATLFAAALKQSGISFDGEVRLRDFRVPKSQRFDPTKAIQLAAIDSRPLAEIVRATNKESINLNAELILRTLGRERANQLADSGTRQDHERGDDETGTLLIRQWLERAGISTASLALHDGSGLSRLNLVTPEATVRLLLAIQKTGSAAAFRASLPIAGVDGTLRGRLRPYQDRIVGKTGSLKYDNSLSGFVTTPGGEDFAFSIMCNDQTGSPGSIRVIDKIATQIADYLSSKDPKAQKR